MNQTDVKKLVEQEVINKHKDNMDSFYAGNMGEEELAKLKETKAIINNAEDMCISIVDKYVPI